MTPAATEEAKRLHRLASARPSLIRISSTRWSISAWTDIFPVLKLGITYPLDPTLVDSEFSGEVENRLSW